MLAGCASQVQEAAKTPVNPVLQNYKTAKQSFDAMEYNTADSLLGVS